MMGAPLALVYSIWSGDSVGRVAVGKARRFIREGGAPVAVAAVTAPGGVLAGDAAGTDRSSARLLGEMGGEGLG